MSDPCGLPLVPIIYRAERGEEVQGWTSLMMVVSFLCATQRTTPGVLGEPVGRIYHQNRGRLRFLALDEPELAAPATGSHRVRGTRRTGAEILLESAH